MMGGDIEVKSEFGKGSTFTAHLPREGAAAAPPSPAASSARMHAATATGGPRPSTATHVHGTLGTVLAIDDDPDVLSIISTHLNRDGFEVYTTNSGEEGLRLAKQIKPDVITLDVMMPNLDGWTVLNQLKGDPATADVPVIMVTILQDREMGYSLGAADYLMKPVEADRLISIVRRYRTPGATPGHVLVVEDDAATREVVRHFLVADNWTVAEAENGRKALELLSTHKPNIVVLDLMMPEMDGFEFVQKMRSEPAWGKIPVIVVTAREVTEEDRKRLNGHVERILQKGVHSREEILSEIKQTASRTHQLHDANTTHP
jgi:CheY-like chemotaxis protein